MKPFDLTINYDGKKTTTNFKTNSESKDRPTLQEFTAAYIQVEFAIEKLKEMQSEIIHKMRELNEKQTS